MKGAEVTMHRRGEPPIVLDSGGLMRFPAERYELTGPSFARGKGDLVTPPLDGQQFNERMPMQYVKVKGEK